MKAHVPARQQLKCDRCAAFISETETQTKLSATFHYGDGEERFGASFRDQQYAADLCDDCTGSFIKFMTRAS